MKLIIVENFCSIQELENKINNSKSLRDYFKEYKIIDSHILCRNLIIEEKSNGKIFDLTHSMNEHSAKNTSDEYFPFNSQKFKYIFKNNDLTSNSLEWIIGFNDLERAIKNSDTILNLCNDNRLSNMRFNALIYSDLFDLKNKSILACSDYIENLKITDDKLANTDDNIQFSNDMKNRTILDLCGLSFEIALNEVPWSKIDKNSDEKYIILEDVIQQYEDKYNLNINKFKREYPHFFKLSTVDSLLLFNKECYQFKIESKYLRVFLKNNLIDVNKNKYL